MSEKLTPGMGVETERLISLAKDGIDSTITDAEVSAIAAELVRRRRASGRDSRTADELMRMRLSVEALIRRIERMEKREEEIKVSRAADLAADGPDGVG